MADLEAWRLTLAESRGFESYSFLDGVPELLRNAIKELESQLMDRDSKISDYILQATTRNLRFKEFGRPESLVDNLFKMTDV